MLETILSWQTVYVVLCIIFIPSCLGLIGIVLLQKGKNMGFAGAFGVNPGGDTVLGPRASRSLPVRMTYFMAGAYMTICVLFALIEGRRNEGVAPDRVDPAEAAALQDMSNQLDALGVGAADPDAEPAQGEIDSFPVEDAADAPAVDDAASVEPDGAAGDVPEGDAQTEAESVSEEDAP